MLGAQQHESVLDAFFEDLIGELLVGQDAGELQRPDHVLLNSGVAGRQRAEARALCA